MNRDLTLPGADIPVIDESRMEAEFGGAPDILAELRDLFLEHAPVLYGTLQRALDEGDGPVVADTAHSLKGACATYGAERLTIVCKQMELAARAGDLDAARAYRDALQAEYDAVVAAVGQLAVG